MMINFKIKMMLILFLIFDSVLSQTVIENCILQKVQNSPITIIFSYKCSPPTQINPAFPTGGSSPTEFTQLILSPNVYTIVPISDLCQFSNINLLDLSSNAITSTTGLFKSLKCLTSLKTISLANNNIQSSLLSTDFDDTFSSQLQNIDFSNNQIPFIESGVFLKSDDTSRFINLGYLNLKNNQIRQLDLLWPLTIPSTPLFVDLSTNPINTLVNGFNKSYSSIFSYPVTGFRNVVIQNNQLQAFSDSNLLQYGLQSLSDLSRFLNQISNYDFRINNASNSSTIICTCPPLGLQTVSWYKQLLAQSSINTAAIINKLYCSNMPNTYPLNIDCSFSSISATTVPVITITLPTVTTKSILTISSTADATLTNSTPVNQAVAGALSNTSSTSSSSYYYIILLLIPLILLLLIILCCLRPCNKYLYTSCNTTCFKSCRPGENNEAKISKKYDMTIVYSENDQTWVRTKLLPIITNQGKAYKIHLMTTYHKGFDKSDTHEMEILTESKRIILIMSKSFINEEWKSENFQTTLKSLCAHDSNCVIIPITINGENIDEQIEILEEYDDEGSCIGCKKKVKYSTSLKDIEQVNGKSRNFSQNLKFLLPILKKTGTDTITTESKNLKRDALSPFNLAVDDEISFNQKVTSVSIKNERSANIKDDLPLITRMRKKNVSLNEDLVVPFNEPTPREKRLKNALLNNYLKPYDGNFILNQNEIKESLKSPREIELQCLRQKSTPIEIEQPKLIPIQLDPKIPNRHSYFEINPYRAINSAKNVQNSTDSRFINYSVNKSFIHPEDIPIPTSHRINIPGQSNLIVPVVSASHHTRQPEATTKETLNNNKKKQKKHKNKKHRSKTVDYNILPINEDLNISYISYNPEKNKIESHENVGIIRMK